MSTQVISIEQFNHVCNGLAKMAKPFKIDGFYSWTAQCHFKEKGLTQESERLIKSWMELNELTYDIRYKENPAATSYSNFFQFKPVSVDDSIQLYKFMESIRCNIELEDSNLNEQQKADITLLDKFLHDLLKSHMRIDKAYDSAKWTIG